ncbi:SPOR domain-containing protein [Celeribacter sp.]|uniref:SPOR domain-containing protein n=1 Tax=Celeribacter sp. TaxID=1890673 RepID=UPI003A8FEF4B
MTQDFQSRQGVNAPQLGRQPMQPNHGYAQPRFGAEQPQPRAQGYGHAPHGAQHGASSVHSAQQSAPYAAPHAAPYVAPHASTQQPVNDAQFHAQSHMQAPHAHHGYAAPDAGYDDGSVPEMPRLGLTQWAGAAVSLVLVLTLGVWGYKQMVRDVSGVPVIRAMTESARSVPEDPGGQLAMHQGLAVNSVTADGSAAAPADRLTLAPKPIALTDEDQPMGEIEPEATLVSYTPETNAYATSVEEDLTRIEVEADPLELDAVEEVAAPLEDAVGEALAEAVNVGPEINISPMPQPRPVRLAAAQATAQAATRTDAAPSLDGVAGDILAAVGASGEVAAADLSADAAIVQLGAFPKRESALIEWDRLSAKFEDFMAGKQRVVVEATSGGKPFYRLRAVGFENTEDSKRFCAALNAMNTGCVPVARN